MPGLRRVERRGALSLAREADEQHGKRGEENAEHSHG